MLRKRKICWSHHVCLQCVIYYLCQDSFLHQAYYHTGHLIESEYNDYLHQNVLYRLMLCFFQSIVYVALNVGIHHTQNRKYPLIKHKSDRILIEIFPDADFTDPTWGIVERDGYSIEFNISEEHDITSFMLHIRGDNRLLEAIELIHNNTGWRPMDEELIDFNGDPGKGLRQWQNAREQVLESIRIKKKWWKFWVYY
jgi:hypothetical protein